jgi:hypothetical protein
MARRAAESDDDVRRLRFSVASTQSRLGFSGGRVTPVTCTERDRQGADVFTGVFNGSG